jgi:hypothetical protein
MAFRHHTGQSRQQHHNAKGGRGVRGGGPLSPEKRDEYSSRKKKVKPKTILMKVWKPYSQRCGSGFTDLNTDTDLEFKVNPDTDTYGSKPDPGFRCQKSEGKKIQMNFFFFIKNCNVLKSKLPEKPSALKREHPALFSMFVGKYCLPGSNPDPVPDPQHCFPSSSPRAKARCVL